MSSKTKIEWTDMTSNPIHLVKEDGKNGGHWCKKISEGCANCYAEEINLGKRFEFASHLKYAGEAPNLILDEAVLQSWVKLKKPHKIFVCSMTDMFGEWVSDAWLDKIFTIMAITPHHTYQVLTKRPERMLSYLDSFVYRFPDFIESICANFGEKFYPEKCEYDSEGSVKSCEFLSCSTDLDFSLPCVLPNVWLGTSIENQKAVSDRASHLYKLHNRGWTTFYSVEPLLEKVELFLNHEKVDWVIVGGESGKGARLCHYEWILNIVEQCQKTGVPVFVKQLGSNPGGICTKSPSNIFASHFIKDSKGGDIQEFPLPIQVREFPKVLGTARK